MRRTIKSSLLLLIGVIGLVGLISACSSSDTDSTTKDGKGQAESPEETGTDNFYSQLKEKGVIEVGSTPTGPPFTFLNTETNELDGIMIDIAKRVGEELNLKVNTNSVQWTSLIPSIQGDKIDLIAAGMSTSKEREEVLDFSKPVYVYGESVIIAKNNNDIKSFEDLEGKKVGVQEGSTYYTGVQDFPKINIQTYKTHQDMSKELKNGRIDAFFADFPIYKSMIKALPELENDMKYLENYEPQWIANIALGMPKGATEFQEEINRVIEKMEENGELEGLIEKWELE